MNAKISEFVICAETIIYLLLYNLHDFTFNFNQRICWKKMNISTCLNLLEKESILDEQVRWEYLKYEVRKFSIKVSKTQAKKLRLERVLLEKN